MQNALGPTLVAMATKFGLGAEMQSPTGLSIVAVSIDAGSLISCTVVQENSINATLLFHCRFLPAHYSIASYAGYQKTHNVAFKIA